jgi:membrane-associated phospholipid phosphatase
MSAPDVSTPTSDQHPNGAPERAGANLQRPAYPGIFERSEHLDTNNQVVEGSSDRGRAAVAVGGTFVAATAVLTVIYIGIGLLITHFFVRSGLGHRDERISVWFSHHRTGFSNSLSLNLTHFADAPTIIGLVVVATAVMLFRHWGRFSSFLAFAIVTEVIVFEVSEHVVGRPRPHVVHLGVTPPTFSWPSGHTAASVVVYLGLALLVTCATRQMAARVAAWVLAVLLTVGVAWSRLYEGEHHLSDVIGGYVLGLAVLYSCVLILRVWSRHSRRHIESTVENHGTVRSTSTGGLGS